MVVKRQKDFSSRTLALLRIYLHWRMTDAARCMNRRTNDAFARRVNALEAMAGLVPIFGASLNVKSLTDVR